MGIVSIMKFATVVAVFNTVARAANLPNKDTASYKKYLENYGPGPFAWDDPEYIKDPALWHAEQDTRTEERTLFRSLSQMRRPVRLETFRRENRTGPAYINGVPLTKECKTTIRDVFFEGKDTVKFSDWSRIASQQWLIAQNMEKMPTYEPLINMVSNTVLRTFNRIDMDKNEVIDLIELDEELSKIRGYLSMVGTKLGVFGRYEYIWPSETIDTFPTLCNRFLRTLTHLL